MQLNFRKIIFFNLFANVCGFGINNNIGRPKLIMNMGQIHVSDSQSSDKSIGSGDRLPEKSKPVAKKLHSMTVCMVPEAKYERVWEMLMAARAELRDPGLYRWPPHANILYPFFDIWPKWSDQIDEEKMEMLLNAVLQVEPFEVSLDSFGTFGGKNRGVLYSYPRSYSGEKDEVTISEEGANEEPLIRLQSVLQQAIPECDDQKKNGRFTPHITLSHFPSLQEALEGKEKLERWWKPVTFTVNEVYVLKRIGDDGQFKILVTLPLGQGKSRESIVHNPPLAFPDMPFVEEEWVGEERMALKARRNGHGRRGKGRSGRRKKKSVDRGPSKSCDTPEEIARKRAERAAKRERLAQEAAEIAAGDESRAELM